ncbi:phage major capsid protein [Streptomonospora arabica]|uniref:Phage major capsid protein n=1 Tax=Streptomonospora arabica TaxID=412417 RepID=A0ABV9SSQ2_9ACTN
MGAMPDEEPRYLEEREERIKEIDSRIAELDAEFTGTRMSAEAREEWNGLNAERDEHATTVKEMRARRDRLQQITANPASAAGSTERGAPEAPSFIKSRGNDIYELSRVRAESSSEEEFREKVHDNARRAVERAKFPMVGGQSREATAEHVEDLLARTDGRDGWLAKRILTTGNPVYDRAFGKAVMYGPHTWTTEEQRQMALSPDSAGGFAVPFQLDPTVILTSDGSTSPLRQIARVEQITSKTWQGITSSGVTVSRSDEAAEAGDESFTVGQPEVTPTRVIANVEFSVEVDQDWPQLRSEISRLLMDAKEREEDSSFVTGDGTGNNPGGIAQTLAAGSEVEMASAGTLSVEDLYDLESETPVRFRSRGRFLGNKNTYNKIRDLSTGSDGGDLWVRLGSGQPSELLGYPAYEASAMDSIGDADGRVLVFGDFSQFLIVDRLGMTVELQPHVLGSSNRRWTGQRAVVAIWRNTSEVLVSNAFRVLVDPTAS